MPPFVRCPQSQHLPGKYIVKPSIIVVTLLMTFLLCGFAEEATNSSAAVESGTTAQNLALFGGTNDWKEVKFSYDIQHPYNLNVKERYKFDAANNTHDFWVNFTDKPHSPPPNQTTARTEMRLGTFTSGEHMFEGDVNIKPGTFACIAQVFDEAHGPVTLVIAHPDGTVTIGHDIIATNAIGRWWNLKITNDPAPGGKIRFYVDDKLEGTYAGRGPRAYYFKCGVYSRKGSQRSEVLYRNIRMWVRAASSEK